VRRRARRVEVMGVEKKRGFDDDSVRTDGESLELEDVWSVTMYMMCRGN
jgi:hypothetical protein